MGRLHPKALSRQGMAELVQQDEQKEQQDQPELPHPGSGVEVGQRAESHPCEQDEEGPVQIDVNTRYFGDSEGPFHIRCF